MDTGALADSTWERVLTAVIEGSHLATGDGICEMLDEATAPAGIAVDVLLAPAATDAHPDPAPPGAGRDGGVLLRRTCLPAR